MVADAEVRGLSIPGLLEVLSLPDQLVAITLMFVLGAAVGSFLNVCISRWPLELSVVSPRSRCPRCERPIRWHENIPLLSWVLLHGRCRGCELPISVQYPLVELVVALWWVGCIYALGVSFEALRVALFGTVLLGIAITDARHYLIPDGFTVTGLLLMLGLAAINFFVQEPTHFAPLWPALLGACVGAGAITLIGWLAEVALRREAMGFGDTTLMAVIGAAVGAERALLAIIAGAFFGAFTFLLIVGPIIRLRTMRSGEPFGFPDVPFGVFLAPAGMLVLLWGETLIAWYVRHFLSA